MPTNFPKPTPVINNITSTSTTSALSANQGKVLSDTTARLDAQNITGSTLRATWRLSLGLGTAATRAVGYITGNVPELIYDQVEGAALLPNRVLPTSIVRIAQIIDFATINDVELTSDQFGVVQAGIGGLNVYSTNKTNYLEILYAFAGGGEIILSNTSGRTAVTDFNLIFSGPGVSLLTTYGDPLSMYGMNFIQLQLGNSDIYSAENFINSFVNFPDEIVNDGTLIVSFTDLGQDIDWTENSADARTLLLNKGWDIVLNIF